MNTDIILYVILGLPVFLMLLTSFKALYWKNLSNTLLAILSILSLLTTLVFTFLLWPTIKQATTPLSVTPYYGLGIDALSYSFLVVFQFIFFIAGVFSVYYIPQKRYESYFFFFFALQLGMNLVVLVTDLFFLFIMWELMVLMGYVLVIYERKKESVEAGFKYLVISSAGSISVLFGIALLTGFTSRLSFTALGTISAINAVTTSTLFKLALAFLIMGFGVTAGYVFLNQWLPDAHPAAPAPVSALLSGILVKAGIYALFRIMQLLSPSIGFSTTPSQLILGLALVTMTEGNIMVFAQFTRKDSMDIKRILAYSTIVHLGYLLLVTPIQTSFAQVALLFHVINHALAKAALFMITGYLLHTYHSRDLRELQGIGRKEKFLATTIMICLFSLGGLPLTGGFISKLLILIAMYKQIAVVSLTPAIIKNYLFWALLIAVINSALAFSSYLWIIKYLVFNKPCKNVEETHETLHQKSTTVILIRIFFFCLALLIILMGIAPQLILNPLNTLFNP